MFSVIPNLPGISKLVPIVNYLFTIKEKFNVSHIENR